VGSPSAGSITHPPLDELTYVMADRLFGNENLRILPLLFFVFNSVFLFWFVKWRFDKKTALWVTALFSISFYSVLASLMVDTDGQVLPFVFLCMATAYFKWRDSEQKNSKILWGLLFLIAIVTGLLIKLSFAIGVGALVLDFIISERHRFSIRTSLKYLVWLAVALVLGLIFVFKIAPNILPGFTIFHAISYWKSFANISHRNFLQTFIQVSKALMYLSPLLLLPLFFLKKADLPKVRPFLFFVGLGLIFYLILFDFSGGALDRYLQFLILPFSIISGVVFAKIFQSEEIKLEKEDFILTPIIAVSIFVMQFFNQFVPPLYPKAEWLSRIFSLKWNFLFPFTGGSGPTGFYVSFLFIALIWVCSLVFILSALKVKDIQKRALFCVLILGILYNGVFMEEYLFGKINGSVYPLLAHAKEFIAENKNIKRVVVYNDIGEHEIQKTGKYERRLYATPQFEQTYKDFFKTFSGNILYIDIPKIGENNFYSNYLNSCREIYKEKDKYITAQIFSCANTK